MNQKSLQKTNKPKALYIHIPFCATICSYCDFCKLIYNKKWIKDYISCLIKEIDSFAIPSHYLESIYIGGGTPSILSIEEISPLLNIVKDKLAKDGEFTIECNVSSLDDSKIEAYRENGINRVSLGVESSDENLLKFMNRSHSFDDVVKKVAVLKKMGISNINVDLIYAIPGETNIVLLSDIEKFLSLGVPHISTYSLILEKGTILANKHYKEVDQDTIREQYDLILDKLRNAGYTRYEVSNFSKEGYASHHNCCYWRNHRYYGAGLGASGYIKNMRYTNTRNLNKYLKGTTIEYKEMLSKSDEEEYYIMLNLRLQDGFSLKEFEKNFGVNFLTKYAKSINKLTSSGLIHLKDDRIMTTDEGLILLDRVLLEFIDENSEI